MKRILLVGIALTFATMACTVALFENPETTTDALSSTDNTSSSDEPQVVSGSEEEIFISVYEKVNPAVVNIDIGAEITDGQIADVGSGSGFVVDAENGYIVTNNHVVAEADDLRVTFHDGIVASADVVGTDQFADLAVIQVNIPEDYSLTEVQLSSSANLKVGQRVIAIGNPFGLSSSMTVGIISGIGRTLPTSVVVGGGAFSNPFIIQTDAAINPGNSGGPLLNSNGEVIGVNVAIRSETGVNSGIGFAIPVDTVKRIVPQLIENGEAEYPYLGISSQTQFSLAELSEEFDLPVRYGVIIATVTENSAADQAGLRGGTREVTFRGAEITVGGDIIIAIDGVRINNFDELLGYLVSNTNVGQEIIVTIIRNGEQMDVSLVLGARPNN